MSGPGEALADLHRRYDGPIDERLREEALTGRLLPASMALFQASRDVDRLALSSVKSLAFLRAGVRGRLSGDTLRRDRTIAAITSALTWYRMLGVHTIGQRAAVERSIISTGEAV